MARLDRRTALGALHVVGSRPDFVEAAAELALSYAAVDLCNAAWDSHNASSDPRREPPDSNGAAGDARGIRRVEIAGIDAVLKCSPMHGKSALRWGLKRMLLRTRMPRVNEYYNLSWLNERLFATPVPLAGGAIVRSGVPRWQFLITRYVPDGMQLQDWLASERTASERAEIFDEIARELARMHALRFVHRDLWTRNLLVIPSGGLSRVLFLDAWAGGPGLGWRGVDHDRRCFERDMSRFWSADEGSMWRACYESERRATR